MSLLTVFVIAVGLSMDAFAVSVAGGFANRDLKVHGAVKVGLFFGLFQALMPTAGWLAGRGIEGYISNYDHWIAFILLSGIGGKMIFESFNMGPDKKVLNISKTHVLLILSIATSIDALAVGLSLSFLNVAIILPSIIIGVVTFIFSFSGVYIGKKIGHVFENKIEFVGGLILIGIGLKILIGHLV